MNTAMKKIMAITSAFIMLLSIGVFAEQSNQTHTLTLSIEKFSIGQGYLYEPVQLEFEEGETLGQVLSDFLEDKKYNDGVNSENISYLKNIYDNSTEPIDIPPIISEVVKETTPNADSWLGEGDYTSQSGWFFTVNNILPEVAMSEYICKDNDVARIQFSIYNYGCDIGFGWSTPLFTPADKSELTRKIALIGKSEDRDELLADENVKAYYDTAVIALEIPDCEQEMVDMSLSELSNAIKEYKIDLILKNISESYENPSEWEIMDMTAFEKKDNINEETISDYIKNSEKLVNESEKVTDLSKTAIIFTFLGLDPQMITSKNGNTINLIDKIASFENIDKINSAIFSLLCYDCGSYTVENKNFTREKLIEYIKENQHADGGWSLEENVALPSDPDITSMVINALSEYYNNDEDIYEVKSIVDNAITALSAMQRENGNYMSWDSENSNSSACVITALSSIGIDSHTDERFIKNNISVLDSLLSFETKNHQFGYADNTTENKMSTEQGFRALVAYKKMTETAKPYNIYKTDPITEDTKRPLQKKTVTLRIEGIEENKLYEKNMEINFDTQNLKVSDVIKKAVGEENYIYTDGAYGGYFSSLFGEDENTFSNDYDGWQYRVNNISPSLGVGSYNVYDNDEIVMYYGGMNIIYPHIPTVSYSGSNAVIKFTYQKTTYDENYNPTYTTENMTDAEITWHYGDNLTKIYKTDENGTITIPYYEAEEGAHIVQADKKSSFEKDGKYLPLSVRFPNDFSVTLNAPIIPSQTGGSSHSSPSGTVVVNLKKEEEPAIQKEETKTFSDTESHWAKEYIGALYNRGYIKGKTEALFMPDDNITRGEFITILYRISGEKNKYTENDFCDVKKSDWYYDSVIWAKNEKIVSGTSEDTFSPDSPITREQIAVMTYNYISYKKSYLFEEEKTADFADKNDFSSWSVKSISAMQKYKILSGDENGCFLPKKSATRAECAKILFFLILPESK